MMIEFCINEYITLRLKGKKTFIYINDKPFLQCRRLIINISSKQIQKYNEFDSIDDVADFHNLYLYEHEIFKGNTDSMRRTEYNYEISPEEEFWGHCSNLQAWYLHNYDTRLLKSDLAFPLLKKLVDVGDSLAKKVFKEEIINRLLSGNLNVIIFLMEQGYLEYFTNEEKQNVLEELEIIIEDLDEEIIKKNRNYGNIEFYQIDWFLDNLQSPMIRRLYLLKLIGIICSNDEDYIEDFLKEFLYRPIARYKKDYIRLLSSTSIDLVKYLMKIQLMRFPALVLTRKEEEISLFYVADVFLKDLGDLPPKHLNKWILSILPNIDDEMVRFLFERGFFMHLKYRHLREVIHDPDFILSKYFVEFNKKIYFIGKIVYKDHVLNLILIIKIDFDRPILSLNGKAIKNLHDIHGLEKLTNLVTLKLQDNEITHIEGLEYLKNLEVLNLSSNKIKQIQGISSLKKLKHVDLSSNQLENFEGLESLSNLESLNLSNNNIGKLEEVVKLKKIKQLRLDGNNITEISLSETHPELKYLFLNNNQISNISGLNNFPNLQILALDNNSINKIEGFENCINLVELYLRNNKIQEIKGLNGCKRLKDLYLENNEISEIREKNMIPHGLRFISLEGNPMSNKLIKEAKNDFEKFYDYLI